GGDGGLVRAAGLALGPLRSAGPAVLGGHRHDRKPMDRRLRWRAGVRRRCGVHPRACPAAAVERARGRRPRIGGGLYDQLQPGSSRFRAQRRGVGCRWKSTLRLSADGAQRAALAVRARAHALPSRARRNLLGRVVRQPKSAPAWRIMASRVGLAFAIPVLVFVVATIAPARWGDRTLWPPAPGAPTTEVFIVSHGYHAGIIVPRAALAEQASRRGLGALGYLATRFADFDRLEIGRGDQGLFRQVPTAESVTMAPAIRALFRPGNPSVLHVV